MKAYLEERFEYFSFREDGWGRKNYTSFQDGFVLKIALKKTSIGKEYELLIKNEAFTLAFARKKASESEMFFHKQDRPWIYADENGFVDVLEMKASFRSPYTGEIRELGCELLLKLFDVTKKTAYFIYDGVRFFWVYDGEIVNADYPFGELLLEKKERTENSFWCDWGIADLSVMQSEERIVKVEKNMAFYSPRGYNVFAGDVTNFYKDGVYRLLYFYDRHHHGSRFGGGAHSVYQIVTEDFVNWKECGAVVCVDEQWKSTGTGTMFFYEGQYYYSHGWHTSRMLPTEKTGSVAIREKSTENEVFGISYEEMREKGLTPSGANYMVSDDGIHFKSGEYQFHTAENPSVYVEKDGSLIMYGGYAGDGVWKAQSIRGPWRRLGDFEMQKSPLKPSTECPSKFELNGYQYLLVGGTGYWKTDKNKFEFKDEAKEGYDVYDGLFVPMVTKTDAGRLIYSGWVRGYGWGSVVIHRELFQGENGRLYMRWLPELAPKPEELKEIDGFALQERESYYFEADIYSKNEMGGRVGLRFSGKQDCMLVLDSKREFVQIGKVKKEDVYPEEILPLYLRAKVEDLPPKPDVWGDFSIGRVDHIKTNYKLRVVLYYEKKFDSIIIDVEIGGKRTIVSNRTEERYNGLSWIAENVEVHNAKLYKIV